MTLPAPNLDDRSFQDLVDDAKRFIQQRCPEWTDHNVSDPGVTLIEAFAWMTDLMLYRLNRVPDRLYVKFLELLDVSLFPPRPAQVDVDFLLSAVNPGTVHIPQGTVVSTAPSGSSRPIEFTTMEDLVISPVTIDQVLAETAAGQLRELTGDLGTGRVQPIFSPVPDPGDALVLVLNRPAPLHTLRLQVDVTRAAGSGIDESAPPLRWEASVPSAPTGWEACEVQREETGGFNRPGPIVLRLPRDHHRVAYSGAEVALIRCRVVPPTGERSPYDASPELVALQGGCVGAAVATVNAEFVEAETVGESTGVAGQELTLKRAPVVTSDEAFVLHIDRAPLRDEAASTPSAPGGGTERPEPELWELRQNFADSGPDHRHFTLDRSTGVIRFGPMVRSVDGSMRTYGAVPAKGAVIRAPRYRVGGGSEGNVAAGAIRQLRVSIPYVDRVTNLSAAAGGLDGETVDEAKVRGPLQFRSRNRAVTAEDFEVLTREAAPEVRRVRCIPDDEDRFGVHVLIVPMVADPEGEIPLRSLLPAPGTLAAIESYLERRRLVGTRMVVKPPRYVGLRIRARILADRNHQADTVLANALAALYRYFNPLVGGPDGSGWPFGRAARVGEAYAVLQRVSGVDVVDQLELVECDPRNGSDELVMTDGVLSLPPDLLLVSRGHQLTVVPG